MILWYYDIVILWYYMLLYAIICYYMILYVMCSGCFLRMTKPCCTDICAEDSACSAASSHLGAPSLHAWLPSHAKLHWPATGPMGKSRDKQWLEPRSYIWTYEWYIYNIWMKKGWSHVHPNMDFKEKQVFKVSSKRFGKNPDKTRDNQI